MVFVAETSDGDDVCYRLEADGGLIKWQQAARNPKQPFARCQVSANTFHSRYPIRPRKLPLRRLVLPMYTQRFDD